MEWPVNAGSARRSWLIYLLIALFTGLVTWYLPSVASRYLSRSPVQLKPVATEGEGDVFTAPKTLAIEKAERKGKARKSVVTRPVVAYVTEDLPKEEADKIPSALSTVGPDNVARKPVLTGSAIIPPWKGVTNVRSYLYSDGRTELTLDPQPEKFFGLDLRNLELEGGIGTGAKQFDATAAWFPIRTGNVFFGAKAELWMEPGGQFEGAGTLRMKWVPFR